MKEGEREERKVEERGRGRGVEEGRERSEIMQKQKNKVGEQ